MINRRTAMMSLLATAAATISTPASAAAYWQAYRRSAADVYASLLRVIPQLDFKIKSQNDELMRVAVSSGMSAFSWGEVMSLAVVDEGEGRAALEVDGELKMSSNILAKGRVMKHFEHLATAISNDLKASAPAA